MAIAYSGDVLQARNAAIEAKNDQDVEYVMPKEGTLAWISGLAIPKNPPDAKAAHAFMDYLLTPEVAAHMTEISGYANGVAASRAAQRASDDDVARFDEAVREIEALANKAKGTASAYAERSIALQHQLLAMSAGRWIDDIYTQLSNLALWRTVVRDSSISFDTAARRRASANDWRRTADALMRRDAGASEAAARALLHASGRYVASKLRDLPAASP